MSSHPSTALPLDVWLRGRRLRRWAYLALAACMIVGLVWVRRDDPLWTYAALNRAKVRITQVITARALRVRGPAVPEGTVVRLMGIADGGAAARQWLRMTCLWREVMIVPARPPRRDRRGRLRVYLYRKDGVLINERLIARGFAAHAPATGAALHAWFARLERRARRGREGRWGERDGQ